LPCFETNDSISGHYKSHVYESSLY
jgi:hypothetical protein